MNLLEKFSKKTDKYFLTPVCVVPNGRAHLGHIAGPLLKLDILRRFLLQSDAEVTMVSLSDVHESHVTIRSHQLDKSSSEVANHFHSLICEDLKSLDICYDDLINPLDKEWEDTYRRINKELIELVVEEGNSIKLSEKIPHLSEDGEVSCLDSSLRPKINDPVVSGWLRGKCPSCQQPLVGFFCESCGGHFSPAEMENKETAHFAGKLQMLDRESLFLNLPKKGQSIRDHLKAIGVRSDFLNLSNKYMDRNGSKIRLTVPSKWGIDVSYLGLPKDEVLWSYSSLLFGCHLVAGERYKQIRNSETNPFYKDSGVKTILSFGIDNTIPFLVGATGCGLAQNKFKPLDAYIVNYFYDLDGSKFSTSRNHVIWGGDIVTLGNASSDIVRLYLSMSSSEFRRSGFEVEEFLEFHNNLSGRLQASLHKAINQAAEAVELDLNVMEYLEKDYQFLDNTLNPRTFDMSGAHEVVIRWLNRTDAHTSTPEAAASWLIGFILLAGSTMPQICQWLANELGLPAQFTIKDLYNLSLPLERAKYKSEMPIRKKPLLRSEFNACLPVHLRK